MILDLKFIIYILFIHFIADFLCQSRKMGLNKGKSIKWLSYHVLVYTLVTMFGWGIYFGIPNVLLFFTLTFVTHFVTDYITSKASGYAYLKMVDYKLKREKYEKHVNMEGRYNDDTKNIYEREQKDTETLEHIWQYRFWGVIGFDQLIHSITLLLTYNLIHII